MSEATPKREYRSCLNCLLSDYCIIGDKLSSIDYMITKKTSDRFFDDHVVVENEIKDVIGKHCKLFKPLEG